MIGGRLSPQGAMWALSEGGEAEILRRRRARAAAAAA